MSLKCLLRVLDVDCDRYEVYNVGAGVGRSIQDIVNHAKGYFPDMVTEYDSYDGILYGSTADIAEINKAAGFDLDKQRNLAKSVTAK